MDIDPRVEGLRQAIRVAELAGRGGNVKVVLETAALFVEFLNDKKSTKSNAPRKKTATTSAP